MKNKLHFKYNSGHLAIVCGKCGRILKQGFEFTAEERLACHGQITLPDRLCEECLKSKTK
jgi:hypothetical protein